MPRFPSKLTRLFGSMLIFFVWTAAVSSQTVAIGEEGHSFNCLGIDTNHASRTKETASRCSTMLFAGDDPTEGFTFALPYDPSTPTWLRFDGFAENLAFDETGVRFLLRWGPTATAGDGELFFPGEPDFSGVRLPGTGGTPDTTRVPLHFGALLDYAPGGVHLTVEGLGPADYFRLVGDLAVQPVPEPTTWALLTLAGMGLAVARCRAVRRRR